MVKRGDLILLDTSAIIEANKLKFWNALEKGFQLETVQKCIDEIKARNFRGGTRLTIDISRLKRGIIVREVNREILTAAVLTMAIIYMTKEPRRGMMTLRLIG